jgi:hypothetical protein
MGRILDIYWCCDIIFHTDSRSFDMKIEDIDKNFAVPQFNDLDIEWFDIRNAPFELYGCIDCLYDLIVVYSDFLDICP